MAKYSYILMFFLFFSCQNNEKSNYNNENLNQTFKKNCQTVQSYLNDFVKENIDYKKYYNDTCEIRGTYFNSTGSMSVQDRISTHKQMWSKYDFKISDSIEYLPGVNAKTKQIDGSVRFYFDWTTTNSENNKSITIPLYMSFDFDDEGRFVYLQFFGDISSAISSLE
tara:strand:+ start:79 stop:579 length:501 start_codon:yes stop_codon:yes gene_type:complete